MNNEPLLPDHGFPLRVVIPGYVGARMVKWLASITVSDTESASWYHSHDNKLFPPFVTAKRAEREDWWSKPGYALYEYNINSVIAYPAHAQEIQLESKLCDNLSLKGYAYSSGGREVNRVELSLDDGQHWMECEREFPKYSLRNGVKRWTWCIWNLEIPVWKVLKAEEIIVRAWDSSSNTQPRDMTWNLLGMMNNCWYRVKVKLVKETNITFEHPIIPGAAEGGWLAKQLFPTRPSIKSKPPYRLISEAEVAKHNKEDDPWIIVDGVVYDLSEFTGMHPGGVASIVINAGEDNTALFNSIHGEDAKKWLQHFSIGLVAEKGDGKTIPGISRPSKWALQPQKWIDVTLKSRDPVNHNTYRFKFELCDRSKKLGLPIGQHVLLEAHIGGGNLVVRPYTPVSPIMESEDEGILEFVIKIYRAGANPHFQHGGLLTQYLEKIDIGTKLRVKGPEGHIRHQSKGVLTIHGHPLHVKKISMIAGGSGITPMYQLIKAILSDPKEKTKMSLLFANKSLEDTLLREEFDKMAAEHDNFKVWYTISKPPENSEWKYSTGRINLNMMKEHLYPPEGQRNVALVCGPPAMVTHGVLPFLEKWGYQDEAVFEF